MNFSNVEISEISETINDGLDIAARVTKQYFRSPVSVDIKEDDSPVTLADKQAKQAIRDLLRQRFPDDGILGEEQGYQEGTRGTWVIDPIDGTKSFMFGNPLFGTLIAFVSGQGVLAGGLGASALNEKWLADRTGKTRLNGTVCRTSDCKRLENANLVTSSPDFFNDEEYQKFQAVSENARYRRFGGDCYAYAQLSAGWVDLVVESSLYPFDYLALVPLVEQAGGVITDWQGRPLGLHSGPQVIAAATDELHAETLKLLN